MKADQCDRIGSTTQLYAYRMCSRLCTTLGLVEPGRKRDFVQHALRLARLGAVDLAVAVTVAEPDHDAASPLVDGTHQPKPACLLDAVLLVNADGINPHQPWAGYRPTIPQHGVRVYRHGNPARRLRPSAALLTHHDGLGRVARALRVRDGLEPG